MTVTDTKSSISVGPAKSADGHVRVYIGIDGIEGKAHVLLDVEEAKSVTEALVTVTHIVDCGGAVN